MSLRALFEELVELPAAAQRDKLASISLTPEQQRQLLAMLQSAADGGAALDLPLENWLEHLGAGLPPGELPAGTVVGPFEVLDRLGSGGTAVVYRAQRPAGDGVQQVALKLLRTAVLSHDEERRLRREQAILAQLSHPNIARLVEGGLDGGSRPFIAMELVDGQPITQFAEQHALGLRERLQLFATLCRAIQSAHAALVVHCDLKPSNVLVDAHGRLKVLDFGIARLMDSAQGAEITRTVALTPEYAAPEQFRPGPPSTLVDIYALGVLLGELLTGLRLVGNVSASAAVRAARLSSPRGLPERNKLAQKLRGDLDSIVRHATAQRPEDRYSSAQALAEDIDRCIANRPVRARPASALVRGARLLARHPVGAAASVASLAALVALALFALQQAGQARAASEAASLQAQRADAMRDIAFTVFEKAEPGSPRAADATVGEAVEQGIAQLEPDTTMDRRVRLEVLSRLADVVSRRGNAKRGRELHARLVEEADATLAPDDDLRLGLHLRLVHDESEQGDYAAARARVDRVLAATERVKPDLHLEALRRSALVASHERNGELAMSHAQTALDIARSRNDPALYESVLTSASAVMSNLERWPQAKRHYAELLALARARAGDRHEDVARAWSGLGRAERGLGNLAEAETAVRNALAIDDAIYNGPHYHTANHLNALIRVLLLQRKVSQAHDAAVRSLEIGRATLAPDDRRLSFHLQDVGWTHALLERHAEAEPYLREAYEQRRAFAGDGYDARVVQASLGYVIAHLGDTEAGAAEIEEALQVLATRPEYAEQYAVALEKRFAVARLARQPSFALALAHRMDEPVGQLSANARPRFEGRGQAMRGIALVDLGRHAEAVTELEAALAVMDAQSPRGEPVLRADAQVALATAYGALGDAPRQAATRAALANTLRTLGYVPKRF